MSVRVHTSVVAQTFYEVQPTVANGPCGQQSGYLFKNYSVERTLCRSLNLIDSAAEAEYRIDRASNFDTRFGLRSTYEQESLAELFY